MQKKVHSVLTGLLLCTPMLSNATLQTVTVTNNVFTPTTFTITAGDTVRWVWVAGGHTTTSLSIPSGATSWNAQLTGAASQTIFEYRACVAGTYNYQCTPHAPGMAGNFTVTPLAAPAITPVNPQICPGGAALLSTTAVAGISYQWKMGATNVGTNTNTYSATALGSYTVTVTNGCGQSQTSAAASVTAGTSPVITAAHTSTSLCAGKCDTVTLSSSVAGTTYTFTVQGIPTVNPVPINPFPFCNAPIPTNIVGPQIITITGTAPSGCTGTTTQTITGLQTPKAAFTHTHAGNAYAFTNTSSDTGTGATWLWNFGDGSATSALKNPSHIYTTFGNKTVSLKVTNSNGCNTTITQMVTPTGISSFAALGNIGYYPNPASDKIMVSGLSNGSVALLDASGRLVISAQANLTTDIILNTSHLPAGIFLLRVQNDKGSAVERVAITR